MATLEDAVILALVAHKGQTDKAGAPYFLHPLRVMMKMSSDLERMVAVLHDVMEDTGICQCDLRRMGYPEEAIEALLHLTKREDEGYDEFVIRAASNPVARRVKLADLEDNMDLRRLPDVKRKDLDRLKRYIRAWHTLSNID